MATFIAPVRSPNRSTHPIVVTIPGIMSGTSSNT